MDRLEQEVLGYRNKPTVDNIYDNALIFHLIPNFAAHRHTGVFVKIHVSFVTGTSQFIVQCKYRSTEFTGKYTEH